MTSSQQYFWSQNWTIWLKLSTFRTLLDCPTAKIPHFIAPTLSPEDLLRPSLRSLLSINRKVI